MEINNQHEQFIIFDSLQLLKQIKKEEINDIKNNNILVTPQLEKSVEKSKIHKSKKNRCSYDSCNIKLGLIPFECRCDMNFCSNHRLPEQHNCSFNYKDYGKKIIEQNNQKVVAEKIQKI